MNSVVSKNELRKEFSRDYARYYAVPLFTREGFKRFVCKDCGKGFWSAGERENCGDSAHAPYSFFRKPAREISYADFWKKFADYWRKNGHEIIPRYPVLSRWRDDLYFTIASIVDFQRLEDGKTVFEYPANPLMVPQICLRFPDIANIGVTGRHLSGFMMAGQHAFGAPRKGYWMDKCLEYNYGLLTKVMGIKKGEITYAEDVWTMPDFSAFGPCVEAFSKGSELVNSVFMQYYLDGGTKKELPTRVVDVGWGFERLLWYYRGDYTIYDATFPKEITWLKKESCLKFDENLLERYAALSAGLDVETVHDLREEKRKIAGALGLSDEQLQQTISPMQAIYAIADHSRSLLFALADGALPSNTAGGYNLRVLLRRVFSFSREYFPREIDLLKLLEMHGRDLKPLFPELSEGLDGAQAIIEVEKTKYNESVEKARRRVTEVLSRNERLDAEKMALLYESHGVTPEIVEEVAREKKAGIEIPTDFYSKLTEKHLMEKKAEREEPKVFEKLPATKLTYYEKPWVFEGKAKVLAVHGNQIVLDATLFYPEGGGQCADHGFINELEVFDAQRKGGVVVHYVKKNPPHSLKGKTVKLRVNEPRRQAITRHHSATHAIIASARATLGKHVWQCGSKKDEDEAHLDVTHYARLSREQKNAIEALANDVVLMALPITVKEMDRGEAEKRFTYRLYQGGGAISKKIRIVEIKGFDVEACGGLHRTNTGEIGFIKITKTEQVQDGVLRIHYKSGPAALRHVQNEEALLEEACAKISVNKHELPNAVERFFEEWKERGKQAEESRKAIANLVTKSLIDEARELKETLVKKEVDADPSTLDKMVLEIARAGTDAVLWNREGFIAAATHRGSERNAAALLKAEGAKGGGKKDFARGKK